MPDNRSIPTLEDVARAAGVSTATVSRCLNSPDRVVKETRDRVMEAVESLGYTPNFGARVMAAKRTYTIGAIIPTMENAVFARGLQAFQEELHRLGYTLLVSSTAYRADVEKEHIRALVARGADGLLLIGHDRDASLYDYLERQRIPALITWAFSPDQPRLSVGFDNRKAMRLLAEKVLDLGHENIAVISGNTKGNDRAAERLEGIRDALIHTGRNPQNLPIIETPYGVENGQAAFEKLMLAAPPLSVVMCGNDVLAVGALRGAKAMGLRVPQDVSVTGFDDIELARVVTPSLTTVHVPHHEMGRKAAIELVHIVEGTSAGVSVEVQATLRLRESLGPARQI
ncbi:MAG: LacI family DNA-binding transcriptional regulator [Sulfitobacter sp.]